MRLGTVGLCLGPYGGPGGGGADSYERGTPVHVLISEGARRKEWSTHICAWNLRFVFKAHRLLCHLTLGFRVIKKKKNLRFCVMKAPPSKLIAATAPHAVYNLANRPTPDPAPFTRVYYAANPNRTTSW